MQLLGLEEEGGSSEMQTKVDELQAKKQHLDQIMAQISNTNRTNTHANNLSGNIQCYDRLVYKKCIPSRTVHSIYKNNTNLGIRWQINKNSLHFCVQF